LRSFRVLILSSGGLERRESAAGWLEHASRATASDLRFLLNRHNSLGIWHARD
jgi:hypothetical protein